MSTVAVQPASAEDFAAIRPYLGAELGWYQDTPRFATDSAVMQAMHDGELVPVKKLRIHAR